MKSKYTNTTYQPRAWQEDAFKKIHRCNGDKNSQIIPVSACVGSGKTDAGIFAFGDFIKQHEEDKTFQMFVTPRIRLNEQQKQETIDKLSKMFGLETDNDFTVKRIDCQSDDQVDKNKLAVSGVNHVIYVICCESLWGKDVNAKHNKEDMRYIRLVNSFQKMIDSGWIAGNIVYDEAHNYKNKQEKMFGHVIDNEVEVVE